MVLVATLGPATYKMFPENSEVAFPEELLESSRKTFQQALKLFLPEDTPNPPIIFISLRETCESILEKVKRADVVGAAQDGLQLEFSKGVCAQCGITIGMHNGVKVACTYGEDWSNTVPYNESLCHPIFVPKYSPIEKIGRQVVAAVKSAFEGELRWPELNDEVCAFCRNEPGTRGCTLAGSKVRLHSRNIDVEHTNALVEVAREELEYCETSFGGSSRVPTLNQVPVEDVSLNREAHQAEYISLRNISTRNEQ